MACPIWKTPGRVLVVDDEAGAAELIAQALQLRGYLAEGLSSGQACLDRLSDVQADVVLTDLTMPEMSGLQLCSILRDRYPDVLPIVVTGRNDANVAIEAMRAGAYDYVVKPVTMQSVELAVSRALDHLAIHHELCRLRDMAIEDTTTGIAGTSSAIQHTLELVHRIARSDATVLITGETGTGKERIARAVHQASERRAERFVALNCGAMPVPVLESELFGHVRGAFTGADREREGLFLHAAHGTILLDEVGDMPIEMQAKLLRVLQERSVRPVGADKEVPLFARVIAATSRDLDQEVAVGRFRKDLYYRINVVSIPVPALRERQEDILPLALMMLRTCAARIGKPVSGMTVPTARVLLEYDWPGNVRELENGMERAVAVCRLDQITVDDLPEKVRVAGDLRSPLGDAASQQLLTLAEMRLRYLRKALASCRGNKSLAARMLGIDRRTISHLLVGADHE